MKLKFNRNIPPVLKWLFIGFLAYIALNLLLLIGFLAFIFFSETLPNRGIKEKSKTMAIESAKEKYGIDIKIEHVSLGSSTGGMEGFTWNGTASVTALYNDEEISFRVLPDRDFIADDYQAEEIDQAFREFLPQYLGISEPLGMAIEYGYDFSDKYSTIFFDAYYDGTNIEELYKAIFPTVVIAYPNNVEIPKNIEESMYSLAENREYSGGGISLLFFDYARLEEITPLDIFISMQKPYAPYITHKIQTEIDYFFEEDKTINKIEQTNDFYSLSTIQDINLPQPNLITLVSTQAALQDFSFIEKDPPWPWDLEDYWGTTYEQLTPTYAKESFDGKPSEFKDQLYISKEDLQYWKDQGYTNIQLIAYKLTSDGDWYQNWVSGGLTPLASSNKDYNAVYGDYYYIDFDYDYINASYITFVGAKGEPEPLNAPLNFSDYQLDSIVYLNPLYIFLKHENYF